MSEFEKELDAKIKYGEIMKERYKSGCIVSSFVNLKDIESTFKDWQPPKPLVVAPQRFADWIESQTDREEESYWYISDKFVKDSREKPLGIDYFVVGDLSLYPQVWDKVLLSALVDGYTVEKEKLYEIRLPLPRDNDNDYALVDVKGDIWEDATPTKYKLTESEVKNIDERYWAFAVPVEEVEP